jgi:uncharacterized HAD superfamily protein
MRIGVDIDGVVADFVRTFIPLVRERYGVALAEHDIYVHDLFLVLGITEPEAMELIRAAICSDLDLIHGAKEAIDTLNQQHDVTLLTARPEDLLEVTRQWLSKRGIRYRELLHLREGQKSAPQRAFDVVVDDHLREVIRFAGKARKIIVFDHPWNQSLNVRGLFDRAYTWEDVLAMVDAMKAQA